MNENRPLSGVKVVELATFVAGPAATRFMADQGADVIKVEALAGDGTRWAAEGEARPVFPDDPQHNLTFEIENGNKKSVSLDLKDPECFQIFMDLLAEADVFVTNWRPKALKKLGLDYESLKEKFPKLVYGSATGFGEEGPDCDLPGYDFTAFWTRSGILGSLYERGTEPMNLIPSMGDRAAAMCLCSGILAALFNAQRTGRGEKVSVSLMGAAIYMQGTMMQTAQYGLVEYPITKAEAPNPLMCCYETKDGRWIQTCMPIYNMMLPAFAKAMGHPEWLEDPRFKDLESLNKDDNKATFSDEVKAAYKAYTTEEAVAALTEADIAFAVAQTWKEVLEDPQAWANDCFYKIKYDSGEVTAVRNPVQFAEAGLPEMKKAPLLGADTIEVLKECGVSDEKIEELIKNRKVRVEQ